MRCTTSVARVRPAAQMQRVQSVVVGAGVVGLAVARALSVAGREVLVLESTPQIGSATSSRNSGIIHVENLQDDKDDPRAGLAKECGIRGSFAMFRDGAVWEFLQDKRMDDGVPQAVVDSIGGSSGVKAAATAVMAVVKLSKLRKKEDKKE